jgi:cellulose synthase/poly-beta-1,6-N-acetylglucosamine synthase-like glycosyltransferase
LHILLTILLGIAALLWAIQGVRAGLGMSRLPRIERIAPLEKDRCPRISIVFAARDEAEKLAGALETLLKLDYPDYEVIAVDDRSKDATPQILDDFAKRSPRLRVVHVTSLPPGWIGKTHALDQGYQIATGSFFVFTDADVHFAPDVLGRVMALVNEQRLDHLSLFAKMVMVGFWERVVMTFFGLGFSVGVEAWRTSDPRSSAYVGIGAFQIIRREVYEAVGGYRRLALQVPEDMKVGKIVKQGGFRSQVAFAAHHVSVRWQAGLGNLVRGTTKTFFGAASFSLRLAVVQITGILFMSVMPWVAFVWLLVAKSHGLALVFAAIAVGISFAIHVVIAVGAEASPLYGLTHPIGALIFAWMLTRSTFVTYWQGGVNWRETFYPLAELRRNVI